MALALAHSAAGIDRLLERYLSLLDQYTELRASLGAAQASMFQSLARANFSAPRGIRYGPDLYDQRMQATRRITFRAPPLPPAAPPPTAVVPAVTFTVAPAMEEGGQEEEGEDKENEEEEAAAGEDRGKGKEAADSAAGDDSGPGGQEDREKEQANGGGEEGDDGGTSQQPPPPPPPPSPLGRDPLRWFGIVTPAALRQAQRQSLVIVEDLIPQLASISAEMAAVEILVRRARKKRAEAEVSGDKGRKEEAGEGGSGVKRAT